MSRRIRSSKRRDRAPADLPVAGQPRPQLVDVPVAGEIRRRGRAVGAEPQVPLVLGDGAGADERELAAEDVDQLGQLVERGLPQPAAQPGHPRVACELVRGLELTPGVVVGQQLGEPRFGIRVHRPELPQLDLAPAAPDPLPRGTGWGRGCRAGRAATAARAAVPAPGAAPRTPRRRAPAWPPAHGATAAPAGARRCPRPRAGAWWRSGRRGRSSAGRCPGARRRCGRRAAP